VNARVLIKKVGSELRNAEAILQGLEVRRDVARARIQERQYELDTLLALAARYPDSEERP